MDKGTYYQIMNLPLFQGIGGQDLARIGEYVLLEPDELPASTSPLLTQGSICTSLVFLLSGSVVRTTRSMADDIRMEEFIEAPAVLEPESLYSLSTCYASSYHTLCASSFLCISKQNVGKIMQHIPIFRINFINMLSTLACRSAAEAWSPSGEALDERILAFINSLRHSASGQFRLHIKMVTLANQLHETRLSTSKALRRMEKAGTLKLGRGLIYN